MVPSRQSVHHLCVYKLSPPTKYMAHWLIHVHPLYMYQHLPHLESSNSTMMLYWQWTSSMSTNCHSLQPFQDISILGLWNSYVTKKQLCSVNTSNKSIGYTDNEDSVPSTPSWMGNSNHFTGILQRWEYNLILCPTMNMSLKSNANSEP